MKYAIWCVVDGLAGHREAWAKDANGDVMTFDSLALAEVRATQYRNTMGRNSPARFLYVVTEYK